MLAKAFFIILAFNTVFFLLLAIKHLYSYYAIIDSYEAEGLIKDARVSNKNIFTGVPFENDNYYLYFTYDIEGITHGSVNPSPVKNRVGLRKVEELAERFQKEGPFHTKIFISNKDNRMAYILSPDDVKNKNIFISILSAISASIAYFMM